MYRRVLHRSLCTATQSATTSSTASTTSIKAISQDLYKESNFRLLVEKFKKASDVERFRKKTGIYEDTVRRLASAKRFSCVRNILDHQKKYPEIDKEGFCSRIITLYGKSRMSRHARKLFDEMPQRNCTRTVLSFNALLAAYLHSRKFDLVHTLFKELPKELSVEPNLVSYNILIKALCESGSFDSGLEMLEEMEKKGLKPDLITFNTLLDALYANGRFEDGEKLWVSMRGKGIAPDIRTCNSRLMGLALEKKTKEAVEFIEEMKKDGVKPDVFSFNALIKGFVNEGNLDEAKKWFGEIGKSEFDPHKVTYATLVPFLCEKGDLKTAHEVSKDIFNHRLRVDGSLLQLVVDKLVAESMVSEAEEIVELGKANKYCRYKLNLPGPAEEKKSE
ncbi:pentatricopeptide repeat-containing protein At1g55890, mitochondrial-like [Arachis stenosperma]|uniref:pentatricopeptide repeat-containing protein At1g55890, mitochondrial-like n=1 Tax=Arachis stenosperma TaxID=217475 RepID=UPI0025AD0525|nr:pentatricopeptide repeat-containing protein At1g55890, mitochondrial-like [Arachis stenosperma]